MTLSGLDLDTRVLSDFIYALNIARRQILSYPPGHPVIASANAKLLSQVSRLLEFRPEVTIGIARNVLVVDGHQLDPGNHVYLDLATCLFDARVASLTIGRNVTEDEIRRFFEILRLRAEMIAEAGGIARLLATSGFRGIQVKEIDFAAFRATEVDTVSAPKLAVAESESAVLWKAFVAGLVDGTLDPDGVKALPSATFDPELLAEAMNQQYATAPAGHKGSYEQAITAFLKQADREQLTVNARQENYGRLGRLADKLSPELRRQFLNSTFGGVAGRIDAAEELLSAWPQATLLDALEQVDAGQLQIPETLLAILGKLAKNRPAGLQQKKMTGAQTRTTQETARLLEGLFRGGESGRFVPTDYRDALAVLAVAEMPSTLDPRQVDELLATLNGHAVEQQFCAVMLDLVDRGIGARSADAVRHNLQELVDYFLETGDFASLNSVHEHLTRHFDQPGRLIESLDTTTLQAYASEQFITRILDGLELWGKDQFPAIRELIGRVGLPFAGPLMDRLAEEATMSRRRLLIECLQKIGARAVAAIVARLQDPRWYLVRNLVILLREIDDPSALPALARLFGHPHPKVQAEVMRALLHFQDPEAERYLLQELDSRDPAILLNAARLAAGSCNSDIACRLAELLNDRSNAEQELALKSTIIKTLAEIGCVEVLPELADFIEARSLFTSAPLQRLKVEAATSLARYADPEALKIAERISRKGSGELAQVARQVGLQLKGRLP